MIGKKIIANLLLLSSITGLSGHFSEIQAVVSEKEWEIITGIEDRRHDPSSKDSLISYIMTRERNTNIEFYYKSVLCKLLGSHFDASSIHLDDKTSYEKEFFATLMYRILGYKLYNNIPINLQELSCISDFLTQKIKKPDDFKKFNDMDKLNITRICLMCSEHDVLDRSTLNGVLEIIGHFIKANCVYPKLLITYVKIPGPQQSTVCVECLNKAIEELPANDPQRIEALIALGKVPDIDTNQRIAKLKEAITRLNELGKAKNDPQRIEALMTLGKIPRPQQSAFGIKCLKEVIGVLPANDPKRIEAVISLCKIPGPQQSAFGIKCLKEVIERLPVNDPQRIEAVIALGKVPDIDVNERIAKLREVIGVLPANDPQRIEALITLGQIPAVDTTERIAKLKEAITKLNDLGKATNDPQRIKALIVLCRIPGPHRLAFSIECLNKAIEGLPTNDPKRIDALIALCRIPSMDVRKRIGALEELSRLRDKRLICDIAKIANNILKFCRSSLSPEDHAILETFVAEAGKPRFSKR